MVPVKVAGRAWIRGWFLFSSICQSQVFADPLQAALDQKWPEVVSAFKGQELSKQPVNRLLYAYASLANGDYPTASKLFSTFQGGTDIGALLQFSDSLVKRLPRNPIARLLRGDALARRGTHSEAIHELDQAILSDARSALLYDIRGALRALAGDLGRAALDFEKAAELQPALSDAHYNRGICLFMAGDLQRAVEAFKTALMTAPQNPTALNGVGVAAFRQGDRPVAMAQFRAALTANANYTPAAANLRYARRERAQDALSTKWETDRVGMSVSVKTVFDQKGRLIEARYPDGTQLRNEFDSGGNLKKTINSRLGTTMFEHNEWNQLAAVTYPNGRTFSFVYDDAQRLSTIGYPDGDRVAIRYDTQRKAITVSDSTRRTEQRFDRFGRLVALENGSGGTTHLEYDAVGRLSSIMNQHGIALTDLDVGIRWEDDRRTRVIDSPFGSQITHYDSMGHVTKTELGSGFKAFHDPLPDGGRLLTTPLGYGYFDKAGRRLATMAIEGIMETFEWDTSDRPLRSSNVLTGISTYTWATGSGSIITPTGLHYDLRLDKANRVNNIGFLGREFQLGYDSQGNANRVFGQRGQLFAELKYHYDDHQRIRSITLPDWQKYYRGLETLGDLSGKSPALRQDWLTRYDFAWQELRASTVPKDLNQLAADFERFPEEVMRVQANVFGLTFLAMVARPAAIALDWVSKPFGLSLAHTALKTGLDGLMTTRVRDLEQIPDATEVAAKFRHIDNVLDDAEHWSSTGAFAWSLGKALLPSVSLSRRLEMNREVRIYEYNQTGVREGIRLGYPPRTEPTGQLTFAHPTVQIEQYVARTALESVWLSKTLHIDVKLDAFGRAGKIVLEKGIKDDFKRQLERIGGVTRDRLRGGPYSGYTSAPENANRLQGRTLSPATPLADEALRQRTFYSNRFDMFPLPSKEYRLMPMPSPPGGAITTYAGPHEDLEPDLEFLGDFSRVYGRIPVPRQPVLPFLVFPKASEWTPTPEGR
jgi:YD repeat-containing protein